tara:strand:+ start:2355 stop:2726 length:372 start_codon:yes stop_codon:yes gene_type:complete
MLKNLLRKIFWLLLPLIKENYMSKSVDDIIKNYVIGDINLTNNYNPILKSTKNGTPFSSTYIMEFPDGNTLTFKIEFEKNGLKYFFVNTSIIHLRDLNTILNELVSKLEIHKRLIYEHLKIEN